MSTTTVTGPAESDDKFSLLMDRLNSAIHRLKLAAENLYDLSITPHEEHYSAAFVVGEATKELVQIYDDIETWGIHHDFTAGDMRHLNELRQRLL